MTIEELKNIGHETHNGEARMVMLPDRIFFEKGDWDKLIREIEVDITCIQSGITEPTKMSQALMMILRKSY